VREVKNIEVRDLPEMTEIRVESDQPLVYTAYQLSDPLRLVLDISGGKLGKYTEEIPVNQGAVLSVRPYEGPAPDYMSRLEIGLSKLTDFRIEPQNGNLVVQVSKPLLETAAEEVTLPPPTSEQVPAQNLIGVRVEPYEKGIKVIVTGDGTLSPEIFTLKGNRLVADFLETANQVKPNVMNIDHPLLKRIRLGQHTAPKKVRLVMDLTSEVTYELEKKDNEVILDVAPPVKEKEAASQPETEAPQPPAPQEKVQQPAPAPTGPAPVSVQPVTPHPPSVRPEVELLPKRFTGRRISLDFQDADISNVLRLIADVSKLNVVLGEDVKGKITLKLQNVPWDQALDIILKSKGLGQLRDGNVIRVDTNANIAKLQDDEAKAKESLIKAEDLSTRIVSVSYSKAQNLSGTLKKSLSPRGDITVDESTNTLIIKDIPKNLDEVSRLIKILDRQTPQVLIEARVVVANATFARDLGIQWGAAGANLTGNNRFGFFAGPTGAFGDEIPDPSNVTAPNITPPSGFAVNLPASGTAGPLGNLGFTFGKFIGRPVTLDLRISAGETTGDTKLLSSPKVVTLDNKEAVIQQGESIPFETVSQSGTQTQFIDATLNLTVTPHITPDGSVIMKVKATKNAIGTFRSARTGAPSIDKREATTEVLVKDGETTVIGGILETSQAKTIEGVPWFKNIPILGWLFKRQSRTETNNELLIFITPTIVKS
jgi:type IV pilus assembly protein PilQ